MMKFLNNLEDMIVEQSKQEDSYLKMGLDCRVDIV